MDSCGRVVRHIRYNIYFIFKRCQADGKWSSTVGCDHDKLATTKGPTWQTYNYFCNVTRNVFAECCKVFTLSIAEETQCRRILSFYFEYYGFLGVWIQVSFPLCTMKESVMCKNLFRMVIWMKDPCMKKLETTTSFSHTQMFPTTQLHGPCGDGRNSGLELTLETLKLDLQTLLVLKTTRLRIKQCLQTCFKKVLPFAPQKMYFLNIMQGHDFKGLVLATPTEISISCGATVANHSALFSGEVVNCFLNNKIDYSMHGDQ